MEPTTGRIGEPASPLRRTFICLAVLIASAAIGIGIASGETASAVLLSGAAIAFVLIAAIAFATDIPIIVLVRIGFIASFFFKSDISIFKIDEIEDPSGFNISASFLLAVVLILYDHFDPGKPVARVFSPYLVFLLAVLVVFAGVSVINAGLPMLGVYSWLSLISSVVIAYATASHFGRRDRITFLITGLAAGIIFTGLASLAQSTLGWPLNLSVLGTGTEEEHAGTQSEVLGRVPGFLRTANGMAWVISSLTLLVMAPAIGRVRSFSPIQRIVLFAAGLGGTIAVVLSLARGSWIAMIVAAIPLIMLGWLRLGRSDRRRYLLATAAGAMLVLGALSPFSERIYERLTEDDDGSAAIRLPLMENAMRMIADNPLAGVGLNNYRSTMTKYDETGIFVSQVFPNPVHNVYLHVATEAGLVAGAAFCLLFVVGFWESIRSMVLRDPLIFALGLGCGVALIAYAISGIKEPASLGSVRPAMRTFFLLVGIIMAISRIRADKQRLTLRV